MSQATSMPLSRPTEDRVIFGVCSGLAARLGVDVTLVRVLFALLVLLGGPGLIAYFVLWFAMPQDPLR